MTRQYISCDELVKGFLCSIYFEDGAAPVIFEIKGWGRSQRSTVAEAREALRYRTRELKLAAKAQ